MISIIPVLNFPIVQTEDELWSSLISSLSNLIDNGDILICAHTPFSRCMGNLYDINLMVPSEKAIEIGKEINKDPRKVEIVLQSSNDIIKIGRNVIIARNKADIICANAGVDESNAGIGQAVAIPDNPDQLADQVRNRINNELKKSIAVIISDTVGRALRKGAVNIGIGCAGISAMKSEVGKKDLFGYEMKISEIAIIDELASAAELVQGQTSEGIPFVIIRGYSFDKKNDRKARALNRPDDERLFK